MIQCINYDYITNIMALHVLILYTNGTPKLYSVFVVGKGGGGKGAGILTIQ